MDLLEKIAANAARIASNLSESAAACSFLMSVCLLTSMLCIRHIVSGLFAMHRSKSALKKIYKNYSFGQKLLLKHAWQDCLHAKEFCRGLIVFHHCALGLYLIGLLLAIFSNIRPALMPIVAWYTLIYLIAIVLPAYLLAFSLDRNPFNRRKNEFTFRKYHNTDDHHSLR